MSFADDLRRHLDAIAARDLDALAATIARDDVVLVTADGEVCRGRDELLERHRGWFASSSVASWLMVQDQNTPLR